jgi:hypothetical protein
VIFLKIRRPGTFFFVDRFPIGRRNHNDNHAEDT